MINENILKLTGKVSIPEPVEIGHNYKVLIQGSITSESKEDNNDGTFNMTFKFAPVLVELVTSKGQTIKAKDKRKLSQRLRGRLFMIWQESHTDQDFDQFYETSMSKLIQNVDNFLTI